MLFRSSPEAQPARDARRASDMVVGGLILIILVLLTGLYIVKDTFTASTSAGEDQV